MAQSFNHHSNEQGTYNYQPTLASHIHEALHSKTLKVAGGIAVIAAGSLLAIDAYTSANADPKDAPFKHLENVTSVQLDEGARIRHAPTADNEPPIAVLESSLAVETPDGVEMKTEFRNGTWFGVKATDIPNFDSHFDDDGIVWINEQKASTKSDLSK